MKYFAIIMDGAHVDTVREVKDPADLHRPESGVVEAASRADARDYAWRCRGCPRCDPTGRGNPPYEGDARWV